MNRFYIIDDGKPQGPYTLSELRERGIGTDTQVWIEDEKTWRRAGDISGFHELFYSPASPAESADTPSREPAPPPVPPVPQSLQPGSDTRAKRMLIGCALTCATAAIVMAIVIAGLSILALTV